MKQRCMKCDKDTFQERVRDVTLEEHGINKPYKGVYQCQECKVEIVRDNNKDYDPQEPEIYAQGDRS